MNFFKKLFLLYSTDYLQDGDLLQQLTLSETITKLENLIDSGQGDTGRLYHILEFLKNDRQLYRSDQIYL